MFAAGGGPNSGVERKETVDKGAAVLLADAAEQAGVRRYVMVSSMGTDKADPDSDDVFQVYLRAKKAADDDLRARDLDWTVVRPGRLTDDAGAGRVQVGTLARGEIPRADVAAVLAAVLGDGRHHRQRRSTCSPGTRRSRRRSPGSDELLTRPGSAGDDVDQLRAPARSPCGPSGRRARAATCGVGQRQRLQVRGGDVRG